MLFSEATKQHWMSCQHEHPLQRDSQPTKTYLEGKLHDIFIQTAQNNLENENNEELQQIQTTI